MNGAGRSWLLAAILIVVVGCPEPPGLLGENQWYGTASVWTEASSCYVLSPVPSGIDLDCVNFEVDADTLVLDQAGRCWVLVGAYECAFPEGWTQPREGFCSTRAEQIPFCCEGT